MTAEKMLNDAAEFIAATLEKPDQRAWDQLLIYCPREAIERRASAVGAGAREASRLLNKIVDLADDENAVDPLDDAIEYAKKALAILQLSDPVRRTTQGETLP